jgi:predicted Zn-dependent protease
MRIKPRGSLFVVVTLVAGCATNPVTGKSQLSLVSESQEISMGQQGAKDVASSIGLYNDQQAQAYVGGIGKKLAALTERPALPWSYQIVDDPAVNAFALPGGPIFVTRGLLTSINTEAELATVLGHETGHVTARHTVQQISRQEVAQLGLGIGSILSPTVAKYGGLASSGLSLLFLKYSRDNESQADELGFRYALAANYDVRQMLDMFRMLDRLSTQSGQAGKVPQWLETHPDPGNRLAATQAMLDTLHRSLAGTTVNRDGYLRVIDNMVYGVNPRQGFFRGGLFLHPDLKFQIDFPQGWATQNQPEAVAAMSPGQDAIIQLSLAGQQSPSAANSAFLSQQGVRALQTTQTNINGSPAVSSAFEATDQQQQVIRGVVTFLSYGGSTYQILGYTPGSKIGTYNNDFMRTTSSFRPLTDQAALNAQPMRIKLVQVSRPITLEQFYQQYPAPVPVEEIGLINDLQPGQTIPAGVTVKRVVGTKP